MVKGKPEDVEYCKVPTFRDWLENNAPISYPIHKESKINCGLLRGISRAWSADYILFTDWMTSLNTIPSERNGSEDYTRGAHLLCIKIVLHIKITYKTFFFTTY